MNAELWIRFGSQQQGGILVVGHGTRNVSGVKQLLDLVATMKSRLPEGVPMEASFLELASPTIDEAVRALDRHGVRNLLVVPILLFTAAHAREDIPKAVAAAIKDLPIRMVAQSESLGTNEAALALSAARFESALQCTNENGCLKAGACEFAKSCIFSTSTAADIIRHKPLATSHFLTSNENLEPVDRLHQHKPKIRLGLAMVGRGTSDFDARQHMLEFAAERVSRSLWPITWSQTGFFAGGSPTVEGLLAEANESSCDWIVVQPHLLFEGQLSEQLRSWVDEYRQAGSNIGANKRWLVTPTLGADPLLAETFLELAAKSLL